MAYEIKMPQLGLTMEEGTVEQWNKKIGDEVRVGDVLLSITTDKLSNEIESEVDGTLIKTFAEEGDTLSVMTVLGIIGAVNEKIDEIAYEPKQEQKAEPEVEKVEEKKTNPAVIVQNGTRIRVSPLAKKTAKKHGIDFSGIIGSGPGGRIVQKDILGAIESGQTTSISTKEATTPETKAVVQKGAIELMEDDTVIKLDGMRKVIAERMYKAHSEIPAVTLTMKVDVTDLMKFRKQPNQERDNKLSLNDSILKAIAKALKKNMHILVSFDGDQIIQRKHVNLGMAVALDNGLVVPVIKDADKMGLEELSCAAKDLAERARKGNITTDEYKGSTFTISNLGMLGVDSFTPIINQPDAAILGICAIQDELDLDEEGNVFKRKIMKICITKDHRLIDGAVAAKFQLDVKNLLENPINIIL